MNRAWANAATLMNGVCGLYAIYSILAGNPRWAGLMIVGGLGFDGLDGYLSRRAGGGPSRFGRVADSVADAVTFGVAPGLLLAVHSANVAAWAPYDALALGVGALLVALAIARLVYFTAYAHHRSEFIGVPTPQTALAVVALGLWWDVPGFAGVQPLAVLIGGTVAALLMVTPIPFPKIRRGSALRLPMTVTALALIVGDLTLQFRPGPGSPAELIALGATAVASVGLLVYYIAGPFTVVRAGPEAAHHA